MTNWIHNNVICRADKIGSTFDCNCMHVLKSFWNCLKHPWNGSKRPEIPVKLSWKTALSALKPLWNLQKVLDIKQKRFAEYEKDELQMALSYTSMDWLPDNRPRPSSQWFATHSLRNGYLKTRIYKPPSKINRKLFHLRTINKSTITCST